MAPADSLARLRKRVLDRVSRGEVTVAKACREAGISRARYYQLRRRYLAYGEVGLRPKPHPVRPTRQLSAPLVDAIVSYAIVHPTEGERSIAQALALARYGAWRVGHSGVRAVLRRAGLGRRLARLAAAESLSAAEGGPLTDRTLREIRAIERPRVMHIGSATVGAELFADTMYVGKLKGVGTIWQYTMVDGACSFGFARAAGGRKSAKSMARFLIEDVAPVYREAKITLVRINTDGGPEFGRAFTQASEHAVAKLRDRAPTRGITFIAASLSHSVMVRLRPVVLSTSTYTPLKPLIVFNVGTSVSWSYFTWASSMFSGRVSARVTRATWPLQFSLRRRRLQFALASRARNRCHAGFRPGSIGRPVSNLLPS